MTSAGSSLSLMEFHCCGRRINPAVDFVHDDGERKMRLRCAACRTDVTLRETTLDNLADRFARRDLTQVPLALLAEGVSRGAGKRG